jgi:hypothetical protein
MVSPPHFGHRSLPRGRRAPDAILWIVPRETWPPSRRHIPRCEIRSSSITATCQASASGNQPMMTLILPCDRALLQRP